MSTTAHHARLRAERDRLLEIRSAAVRADDSDGGETDALPSEAAVATLNREIDESVAMQVDNQLQEIDAALERLEKGTYGTCEACGSAIADARLEAVPAARLCIDDQAKSERAR